MSSSYVGELLRLAASDDPTLRVLRIKNNLVTAHQLADALRQNTHVRALLLGGGGSGGGGSGGGCWSTPPHSVPVLLHALSPPCHVRLLDLSHLASLTAAGVRHIAAFLKSNTSLTYLDVSGNPEVGCGEAVSELTEALKQNTTLQTLNLSETNLGDEGACVVGNWLNHCSQGGAAATGVVGVSALYVEHCHISLRGTQCFVAALQEQNRALRALRLWGNQVNQKQQQFLQFYLRRNQELWQQQQQLQGVTGGGGDADAPPVDGGDGGGSSLSLPTHVLQRFSAPCPFSARGLPEPYSSSSSSGVAVEEVLPASVGVESSDQSPAVLVPWPQSSSSNSSSNQGEGVVDGEITMAGVEGYLNHHHPYTALVWQHITGGSTHQPSP